MRAAFAVPVLAASIGASAANACSLPYQRQLGETNTEAAERFNREYQSRLWSGSDVVFVGEVTTLRRWDAEVLPRGALKGEVEAVPIVYQLEEDRVEISCGLLSWPTVTFPGIYYATRGSDGQLHVDGMLNAEDIRDQAVVAQFFEELEMPPIPFSRPDETDQTPFLPLWAWLAGTAGISLLAGFSIGRAGRTASNKQKTRS